MNKGKHLQSLLALAYYGSVIAESPADLLHNDTILTECASVPLIPTFKLFQIKALQPQQPSILVINWNIPSLHEQESPSLCCFVVCYGVLNMKTRPFEYFV